MYKHKFFKLKKRAQEFAKQVNGELYSKKDNPKDFALEVRVAESKESSEETTRGVAFIHFDDDDKIKVDNIRLVEPVGYNCFSYVVVWELPVEYVVLDWVAYDTYNYLGNYKYIEAAKQYAHELWKVRSEKAKADCVAFEIVKAYVDEDGTIEEVKEVVEVLKSGKHKKLSEELVFGLR